MQISNFWRRVLRLAGLAAAGAAAVWLLGPVLLPFAVITVVSTVLVMGCSGRMTQAVIRRFSRKEAPHR